MCIKEVQNRSDWLAQLVEHKTPDRRAMSSSPMMDADFKLKKKKESIVQAFFFSKNIL